MELTMDEPAVADYNLDFLLRNLDEKFKEKRLSCIW